MLSNPFRDTLQRYIFLRYFFKETKKIEHFMLQKLFQKSEH